MRNLEAKYREIANEARTKDRRTLLGLKIDWKLFDEEVEDVVNISQTIEKLRAIGNMCFDNEIVQQFCIENEIIEALIVSANEIEALQVITEFLSENILTGRNLEIALDFLLAGLVKHPECKEFKDSFEDFVSLQQLQYLIRENGALIKEVCEVITQTESPSKFISLIPSLLSVIRQGDEEKSTFGLFAIANLARSDECARAVMQSLDSSMITDALSVVGNDKVVHAALSVLRNLCILQESRSWIVGSFGTTVKRFLTYENDIVAYVAAGIIRLCISLFSYEELQVLTLQKLESTATKNLKIEMSRILCIIMKTTGQVSSIIPIQNLLETNNELLINEALIALICIGEVSDKLYQVVLDAVDHIKTRQIVENIRTLIEMLNKSTQTIFAQQLEEKLKSVDWLSQ